MLLVKHTHTTTKLREPSQQIHHVHLSRSPINYHFGRQFTRHWNGELDKKCVLLIGIQFELIVLLEPIKWQIPRESKHFTERDVMRALIEFMREPTQLTMWSLSHKKTNNCNWSVAVEPGKYKVMRLHLLDRPRSPSEHRFFWSRRGVMHGDDFEFYAIFFGAVMNNLIFYVLQNQSNV